jgi:hypothetical protein
VDIQRFACAETRCITRFLNRFSNKYFEPSLRVVGAYGGSGAASCLADRGHREQIECEGTGSSL